MIIVVIMHVLLAYALVSGLAKKVVDKVMAPEFDGAGSSRPLVFW